MKRVAATSLDESSPRHFGWRVVLACFLMAFVTWGFAADAAERVQFESARYKIGPLQLRLARERGEVPPRPPVDTIDGFLTKPEGNGPFPVIVHLHGCGGLPASFKTGADKGYWSEQLAAWGYVVLVVDSFTTRGIHQACTTAGTAASRIADAYGGLAFLARQPFVDTSRIVIMGFSQGGIATLKIVGERDFDLFENEAEHKIKAAIAFYPSCPSDGTMTVPTLILIGELDDWTRASACREMMAGRSGAGSPVKLIVYPGAHHSFDAASLHPGRESFGHRIEYNAAAARLATEEVKRFLAEHLAQ
jgi:dienelactone hydrolase